MTVLVLRVAPHGQRLVEALRQAQWPCQWLPLYEIAALPICAQQRHALLNATYIIATSQAVVPSLATWYQVPDFTPQVWAIGKASAGALYSLGLQANCPMQATSEGLLQALQVQSIDWASQRVVLLTGQGGRTLLETQLASTCRQWTTIDCYQRRPLTPSSKNWQHPWQAIICSSGESLNRLTQCCPDPILTQLRHCQLLLPSSRLVEQASQLGFQQTWQCPSASDGAFIQQLEFIYKDRNHR